MKEHGRTGTIHIKAFYLRRILRIWPLYFASIVTAGVIGCFVQRYHLSPLRLLSFLFLGANLCIIAKGQIITAIAHLWSISVEEQFYAIWPSLARAGGAKLLRNLSIALIPISIGTTFWLALHNPDPFSIWVNSLVQFLFFAIGALLSLLLNGRAFKTSAGRRIAMLALGFYLWMVAVRIGFQASFPTAVNAGREATGYLLAAVGCMLIFLACLQMPKMDAEEGDLPGEDFLWIICIPFRSLAVRVPVRFFRKGISGCRCWRSMAWCWR
jgi:peptidoglycan/LPS O-acetylase OafA/YrhL